MAAVWNVGDRIQNRYEIHRILRGGMGLVYVVYDHQDHQPLALKTFQESAFVRNPAVAERFLQEASAWINLDRHEHVVKALFAFRLGSQPFLTLEYVDGGDLAGWIGTPRLTDDLARVLSVAIQCCDGMQHALAHGIRAHRDIKPQNCLITSDGRLKLSDFGLAKVVTDLEPEPEISAPASGRLFSRLLKSEGARSILDSLQAAGASMSLTGTATGTPLYMAPEQFDDAKHVSVRADVYAFGVVLYEMITGQRPFQGRTVRELERQHKQDLPPPLTVPLAPEIAELVLTCLAKEPSARFDGFGVIRDRLAASYQALTGHEAPRPAEGAALDADAWGVKATALANLGYTSEAADAYQRAIELDPTNAIPYSSLGAVYAGLGGDPREALGWFDHAIALKPTLWSAWMNKGQALQKIGDLQEALRCQEEAVRLAPEEAQVWACQGSVQADLGRPWQAIESFTRAVGLDPHFPSTWCNFGSVWESLEQWQKALECYDRALALNADLGVVWYNRATPVAKLGRQREAMANLEKAAQLGHQGARNALAIMRQSGFS